MNQKSHFNPPYINYEASKIDAFSDKIENKGFLVIEHFFNKDVIIRAKNYVNDSSKKYGLKSFSINANDMQDNVLLELKKSQSLINFFRRILCRSDKNNATNKKIHLVLSKCHSNTNDRDSHKYHFDAYNLTLSMVIDSSARDIKSNEVGFISLR